MFAFLIALISASAVKPVTPISMTRELPVDQAIGLMMLTDLNLYMSDYEDLMTLRVMMSETEYNTEKTRLWHLVETKMLTTASYIARDPTRNWCDECLVMIETVLGRARSLVAQQMNAK